jgi:SOS response regulatory protein OraA/RecX
LFISVLEEERHERKHAEELVAHNTRQLKSLQERLTEKEEETKKVENALEQLKKCGWLP